ncbi:MAG: hypothetical protein AABY32_01220 [Nanoarchaeota archaeon]
MNEENTVRMKEVEVVELEEGEIDEVYSMNPYKTRRIKIKYWVRKKKLVPVYF